MNTYNTLVERRKANEHKQRALTFFQLYQKLTKGRGPWGHSQLSSQQIFETSAFASRCRCKMSHKNCKPTHQNQQPTTDHAPKNYQHLWKPFHLSTWPHSPPHQKTKWTVVQYVSRVFHRQKETLRELYAVAREPTAPVTRNIKPPIWSTKIYVCFAEHPCLRKNK